MAFKQVRMVNTHGARVHMQGGKAVKIGGGPGLIANNVAKHVSKLERWTHTC